MEDDTYIPIPQSLAAMESEAVELGFDLISPVNDPMKIIETERLIIRWFKPSDAPFFLELLNDPAFKHFIGDKKIRTVKAAQAHIEDVPIKRYAEYGYSLNLVALKSDLTPIGMCGLINRDILDHVDIGYAYLPEYCGQGYAYEAATAMMDYGKNTLGIDKIVGITAMDNASSIKLLEKLGLKKQKTIKMTDDDPGTYYFA